MCAMAIQQPSAESPRPGAPVKVAASAVDVYYGAKQALKGVTIDVNSNEVTALIGPSGCGKSTFLRCLNRMNDTIEGCRVTGRIMLDDQDIYGANVDVVALRARVGMVFQKPNPFPKSIHDNVAYGPRIHGMDDSRAALEEIVRSQPAPRGGYGDEVRDRLHEAGTGLSGGQQQRLCIARAIAVNPEVILMGRAVFRRWTPSPTARIEELIDELREKLHHRARHPFDAASRSRQPAHGVFFHLGDLVERGATEQIFTNPQDERTQGYITGRFG